MPQNKLKPVSDYNAVLDKLTFIYVCYSQRYLFEIV